MKTSSATVLAAACFVAASVTVSSEGVAFAQSAEVERVSGTRHESSAPPPSLPEEPPVAPGEPPAAQTGFQIAFRTGVSIPAGKVGGSGQLMSDVLAPQVPVLVELGGKPIDELFVGVYGGFGLGGVAGSFADQCSAIGVSCSAHTLRIGVEGIVYFLPAHRLDPWVGYGIGLEQSTVSAEANRSFGSTSVSGLELAHLMAGMDVRISHYFGIGPYVDVAVGRYTHMSEDRSLSSVRPNETDIANTAAHLWVALGARAVVFP